MDRLQSGVETSPRTGIREDANADHLTVRREQPAARPALNRSACAFDVAAFVAVGRGDSMLQPRGRFAAAAPNAENVLARDDWIG